MREEKMVRQNKSDKSYIKTRQVYHLMRGKMVLCLSTLASGCFREYLRCRLGYGPGWNVKRRGKSSSLHSKKNFLLGGFGFFV